MNTMAENTTSNHPSNQPYTPKKVKPEDRPQTVVMEGGKEVARVATEDYPAWLAEQEDK